MNRNHAAIILSILLLAGCSADTGVISVSQPDSSTSEVSASKDTTNSKEKSSAETGLQVVEIVNNANVTLPENSTLGPLDASITNIGAGPVVVVPDKIQPPKQEVAQVPATMPKAELVEEISKVTAKEDYSKLPKNASKYLPMLRDIAKKKWGDFPTPSIFAAQTEKESCKTLVHKDCWTPYAELKTPYEYGFGFGQITIAYDSKGNGTIRFNKFEELKKMDAELRNWDYADRFNAYKQFVALIILNHVNYKALAHVKFATETDKVAMMLAAYNGGLGGVTNEIKLCRDKPGCDPTRWFGHVETTTKKSKVKVGGYGNSSADINRIYPFDILYTRREKYLPFFDDRMVHPKLAKAPHKF